MGCFQEACQEAAVSGSCEVTANANPVLPASHSKLKNELQETFTVKNLQKMKHGSYQISCFIGSLKSQLIQQHLDIFVAICSADQL